MPQGYKNIRTYTSTHIHKSVHENFKYHVVIKSLEDIHMANTGDTYNLNIFH